MAAARVRIHEATDWSGHPTTIVGVNAEVAGAPLALSPAFIDWAVGIGRMPRPLPAGIAPRNGVSDEYVELQPPLSDEEIHGLAAVCIGGTYEGVEYPGCLDTSEGAFVYDNRGDVLPGRDGPDNLIAIAQHHLGQQALAA